MRAKKTMKNLFNLVRNLFGQKRKTTYLIRSYSGGVWFGEIQTLKGETCILKGARNLWSWEGATCLAQISKTGIKTGKVSPTVESVYVTQVCNVFKLESKAIENLQNQPAWEV
jgi:hypothetical protein